VLSQLCHMRTTRVADFQSDGFEVGMSTERSLNRPWTPFRSLGYRNWTDSENEPRNECRWDGAAKELVIGNDAFGLARRRDEPHESAPTAFARM
jgi:hypothetical protein